MPMEASLGALKEMQDAGRSATIGLSNVAPEKSCGRAKVVPIVSVQNEYNIEDRRWEKALVYCEKEALASCVVSPRRRRGLG